jgi:putative transposase
MRYRSTCNTVYACQYHIVWCPKYRRRVLVGPVEAAFKAILNALCEQLGVEIIASEVMPDHVHLLVSIPPPVPLGDVIHRLKGASSRNLRRQFPMLRRMPSLWTNSTFVATVGGAPLSVVQQYVRNQKVAA